jgi:hypothetical protein
MTPPRIIRRGHHRFAVCRIRAVIGGIAIPITVAVAVAIAIAIASIAAAAAARTG